MSIRARSRLAQPWRFAARNLSLHSSSPGAPRLVDVVIIASSIIFSAATTLGLVGAGGFGLEIITAFHLFEYREASALILVLLALVTAIKLVGATLRRRFLGQG